MMWIGIGDGRSSDTISDIFLRGLPEIIRECKERLLLEDQQRGPGQVYLHVIVNQPFSCFQIEIATAGGSDNGGD